MDWGNLSEMIGSAGVIVSVIYLAVQVRKQVEESRLAATRDLAAQFQDSVKLFAEDEKLVEIYRKGIADYDSLPETDRLRLSICLINTLRVIEQQYIHMTRGNVDPTFFRSTNLGFTELMARPGVQSWWRWSRHAFEEGFRAHIDRMISHPEISDYRSSFSRAGDSPPNEAVEHEP